MFQIITLHKSKYFSTIFHNGDFVTKVTHYLLFNVDNQDLKTKIIIDLMNVVLSWAGFSYKKKKGGLLFIKKKKGRLLTY